MDQAFRMPDLQEMMKFRDTAITTQIGGSVIDTVNAPFSGWETGVCINGSWEIVAHYQTKEAAEEGHQDYVKLVENGVTDFNDEL